QLTRLLGEQRPVRRGIDHHRLELLAEQAALLVLLVDEHQHHVFQRGLADRHGAGQRMQDADLDGVLGLRRQRRCQTEGQSGSGEHPAPRRRPPGGRIEESEHREVPCYVNARDASRSRCLTASQGACHGWSCAKSLRSRGCSIPCSGSAQYLSSTAGQPGGGDAYFLISPARSKRGPDQRQYFRGRNSHRKAGAISKMDQPESNGQSPRTILSSSRNWISIPVAAVVWAAGPTTIARAVESSEQPIVVEPATPERAEYDRKLGEYLQARAAFDEQASSYWNSIVEKRRTRNTKRRNKHEILITDYLF